MIFYGCLTVFIHVVLRCDDSDPSAVLSGARSMPIQLRPACLASGPDLSHELSRLAGGKKKM